jgi:3-deoxy-7-phosphoheptulonate synthase
MVIVMSPDATAADVDAVVTAVESAGGEASVGRLSVAGGAGRVFIGVTGDLAYLDTLGLDALPGVRRVRRVSTSYKLVSREQHTDRSVVEVGGVAIGSDTFTLIAGPCAVESAAQTTEAAQIAQSAGATILRGGAFKPRTSPYAFQGLGEAGLKILADVRDRTGLPIVTEVMSVPDVELVAGYADMLQIGTRSMQNFPLLQAVGAAGRPVLLKRGMMNTIDEWLMAAEYIARAGNLDIVLCERGIRTFEPATRNTLDIAAVPLVQLLSHLPVIVDPSHSGGRRDLVAPLSRAAAAAGADGVIIDVHPRPEQARCDGGQALTAPELLPLARQLTDLAAVLGRSTAAARFRLAG